MKYVIEILKERLNVKLEAYEKYSSAGVITTSSPPAFSSPSALKAQREIKELETAIKLLGIFRQKEFVEDYIKTMEGMVESGVPEEMMYMITLNSAFQNELVEKQIITPTQKSQAITYLNESLRIKYKDANDK